MYPVKTDDDNLKTKLIPNRNIGGEKTYRGLSRLFLSHTRKKVRQYQHKDTEKIS